MSKGTKNKWLIFYIKSTILFIHWIIISVVCFVFHLAWFFISESSIDNLCPTEKWWKGDIIAFYIILILLIIWSIFIFKSF